MELNLSTGDKKGLCTATNKYVTQKGQIYSSILDGRQGNALSLILSNLALQKMIQSIKMVSRGIKIGKEQLNQLAYADNIVLIGKKEIEIKQLFVEMENCQKVRTTDKTRKNKIYDSGKEKQFKTK